MSKVIVIDLVGDDEAVKTERKAGPAAPRRDLLQAPAERLLEVAIDERSQMPEHYRALLLRYFRR
ncbi:hypothetical protein BAC2_00284 [uncultured bacterium]|nr:hypothetical protein BAC2_00284 [uncultured bacterium]